MPKRLLHGSEGTLWMQAFPDFRIVLFLRLFVAVPSLSMLVSMKHSKLTSVVFAFVIVFRLTHLTVRVRGAKSFAFPLN